MAPAVCRGGHARGCGSADFEDHRVVELAPGCGQELLLLAGRDAEVLEDDFAHLTAQQVVVQSDPVDVQQYVVVAAADDNTPQSLVLVIPVLPPGVVDELDRPRLLLADQDRQEGVEHLADVGAGGVDLDGWVLQKLGEPLGSLVSRTDRVRVVVVLARFLAPEVQGGNGRGGLLGHFALAPLVRASSKPRVWRHKL